MKTSDTIAAMNTALHPNCTKALLLVRFGNNTSVCFVHASNRYSETMLTCIKKGKADDNRKHMKPYLVRVWRYPCFLSIFHIICI